MENPTLDQVTKMEEIDVKLENVEAFAALKENNELKIFFHEEEQKVSLFKVNPEHMTRAIAAPVAVEETQGHSFLDIMVIFEKTEFTTELLDLWKGWQEGNLFSSKDSVRTRLSTYSSYLEASKTADEVKNMANAIAYELVKFPEKYDAAGIMIALAQNGGVCNVQKEIGVRTVYAAMMDSMMEHMNANAIETKVLSLLKKNRFALSESVAYKLCKENRWHDGRVLNSHYIIPIQNKMAARIGIGEIPDPNANIHDPQDLYDVFMEAYNVSHLLRVVGGAVNDSHRLINYHDMVEHMEKIRPAGIDPFAYLNDFVFNVDTGKFTEKAIKFLLFKLNILQLTPEGETIVQSLSPAAEVSPIPQESTNNNEAIDLKKMDSVEADPITVTA
jgi:hypothetical protein